MLKVWDLTKRRALTKHLCAPTPSSMAYDANHNILVTLGPDRIITLWNAESLETIRMLRAPFTGQIAVDPKGHYAMENLSLGRLSRPAEAVYSLLDLDSGNITSLDEADAVVEQVLFSNDGTRLAIYYKTKDSVVHIELRDAASQRLILRVPINEQDLPGQGATAAHIFFSEDSSLFTICTAEGFQLWNSKNGTKSGAGPGCAGPIALTSRYKATVNATSGGFELAGGGPREPTKLLTEAHLRDFQFSPSGRYLVAHGGSTGGSIEYTYVWDALNWWERVSVDETNITLFSPSGALMAGINAVGVLSVWNLNDRRATDFVSDSEEVALGRRSDGTTIAGTNVKLRFSGSTGADPGDSYKPPPPPSRNFYEFLHSRGGSYQTTDGQWRIEKNGYGPMHISNTKANSKPVYIPGDTASVALSAKEDTLAYLTDSPPSAGPGAVAHPAILHIISTFPRSEERSCPIYTGAIVPISITPTLGLIEVKGSTQLAIVDPKTCTTFSPQIGDAIYDVVMFRR